MYNKINCAQQDERNQDVEPAEQYKLLYNNYIHFMGSSMHNNIRPQVEELLVDGFRNQIATS